MCKKLFLIPILLLSMLLAGCSTTMSLSKYITPDLQEKGVLLLPVTDRALFVASGVAFTLEDSKGVQTRLNVNDNGIRMQTQGKAEQYFSAFALPEGNYKFVSWELISTAGKPAQAPNEPFTFNIKAGEALYVGNFDVVRFLGNGKFNDNYDKDIQQFQSLYSWLNGLNIQKNMMKSSSWLLPEGKEQ